MDIFDGDVEIELPPDDQHIDPHVRIIGYPQAVEEASALVRQELEPHNKITMKLDVPWTHHSHIIGKGGNTIKQITSRTGVSIHFPDGNKNSDVRKSNQVSINSRQEELSGLEAARQDIRQLTPLIFNFALPAAAEFIIIRGDPNMLRLRVQTEYNVQVDIAFSNNNTSPLLACSVRGSDREAHNAKAATLTLLQAFCGNLAFHMPVQMHVEISPQHYSFILGRNNETLNRIMQQTSTNITLPESLTENHVGGPLSKSAVTISGAVDNVYHARQNIVGCLPLVLMFDLLPDNVLEEAELTQIMQSLSVHIIIKTRRQDGRIPIIVKAPERNCSNIYEAWKLVTKSDKPIPRAAIPHHYYICDLQSVDNTNMKLINGFSQSPLSSPVATSFPTSPSLPGFNISNAGLPAHCLDSVGSYQDTVRNDKSMYNNNNYMYKNLNNYENEDKVRVLVNGLNHLTFNNMDLQKSSSSSEGSCSSLNRLGKPSLSPNNQDDMEAPNMDLMLTNDRRAPGYERKRLELASQNLSNANYSDKRTLAAMAMKEPLSSNNVRTPTDNWAGYGFSKSAPSFALRNKLAEARQQKNLLESTDQWNGRPHEEQNVCSNIDETTNSYGQFQLFGSPTICDATNNFDNLYSTQTNSKTCNLSASSYIDSVLGSTSSRPQLNTAPKDLYSLLVSLNLEQYYNLFADQCVDLKIFMDLDEQDFKELGIKMFGHRRKLLMAVQSLKSGSLMSEAAEVSPMSSLFSTSGDSSRTNGWRDSSSLL